MSAMMLPSQNLSSQISPSLREVPLNAHLENVRDLAYSILSELESLHELRPKTTQPVDLKDAVQQFERDLITAALERTRGNQSQAARLLGIKHTTLNAKVKRYQIR